MNIKEDSKKAFTLVELIVVIVILAILATIAFLSFGSQSSSARDSTRLSDLGSISKGIMVYQSIKGGYPSPDDGVIIYNSGIELGTQGNVGTSVKSNIKASADGFVDPIKKKEYTYAINKTKNKYRLGAFLENKDSVAIDSDFSYSTNATEYEGFLYLKGDNVAILYSYTGGVSIPLQDTGTGVDIAANSTGYLAMTSNNSDAIIADQSISFSYAANQWKCGEKITSIDGKEEYTTKITSEGVCWTTQNMRHLPVGATSHMTDYTGSGNATNGSSWSIECTGSNSSNCGGSGVVNVVYSWHAAMGIPNSDTTSTGELVNNSVCGLLGTGWHLPSDGSDSKSEWEKLIGDGKGNGWTGTKFNGISSIMSGNRGSDGSVGEIGTSGNFWSSSSNNGAHFYRNLYPTSNDAALYSENEDYGYSVLCIKND